MKVSLLRTFFLTGMLGVCRTDAAQQIIWHSESPLVNRTSGGDLMDGSFRFYLGSFSNGFVPTASNMADWAAHWSTADSFQYQRLGDLGSYDSSFSLLSNSAPFTLGAKAYVWGKSQGTSSDEWILFRSSIWTWPSANPSGPVVAPEWGAADANEVILGTVNPSGSPFLMRSAAVRTYAQWKSTVLAGQVLDSPLDDPDGDGVSNLLEFLFGTSPTQLNGPPLTPTSFVEISGQKYLQISIPRLRDRLVSVKVEVSSDMVTWQSGASFTVEVSNTEGLLVVRDLTPVVPGLSKRFMRVKAVAQP